MNDDDPGLTALRAWHRPVHLAETASKLVADQVDFKGNANLATNCAGTGTPQIVEPPQLVE